MSWRKLLLGILASIATLVVVILLFLWFSELRFLKPKIETAVADATGRELHIQGDFSLKVLPTPTLLIEDVSLASPAWGSEPNMLEAGKAYVEVELKSLISPPIVVHDVELHDVSVLYETNEQEESNWDLASATEETPPPEEDSPPQDLSLPVEIHAATASNVRLLMRKPGSDDIELLLDKLTISGSKTTAWQAQAEGKLVETPIEIDARVTDNHVDLKAKADDILLDSRYDYQQQSVDVDLKLSTLDKLGRWLEVEDLPAEDLDLKGNVTLDGNKIVLKDLIASLSGLSLQLDGTIDPNETRADLSVKASGDKLSYLQKELPPLPFNVKADLSATETTIDLKPFDLTVAKNQLNGTAHIENSEQMVIQLDVKSKRLDLSPFMGEEDNNKAATEKKNASKEKTSRYVFDETPLPLEQLEKLQLEVNADIKHLIVTNTEVNNVLLHANNRKDGLTVENSFDGLAGGKFDYQFQLKPAAEQTRMDVKLKVSDYKVRLLSGQEVPAKEIPVTALDANLHAVGSTPRALAASLDGRVVATQGPGRVSNDLIEKFSGDILAQLFSALNPFAKDEKFTNWECSVFAIDFDSGEGDVSGFLLQSEKLMVVGGGEIDLNTEKLQFEFNTKPRKGVGVSADMFVTPFVKLTGTLKEPAVGLNEKGLLLSGGAAILTGGMSFLYTGLVDRATAESDHCQKALQSVREDSASQTKK